jgi:hypothetical protein
VLAGCGSSGRRVSYEPEEFDSTTTHTRNYAATEAQTCEAARRALLSQGYMITAANADLVTGRKSFQPAAEVHVEVEFRVVCALEGGKGGRATKATSKSTVAFATALQDRYGIKKVNNSASSAPASTCRTGSRSVPPPVRRCWLRTSSAGLSSTTSSEPAARCRRSSPCTAASRGRSGRRARRCPRRARSIGVQAIEVEAHVQVRVFVHVLQRLGHGVAHAVLVDVAHVEHVQAERANRLLLVGVDAADADEAMASCASAARSPLQPTSTAGPWPSRHATGMPCRLPLGLMARC